MARIPLSRGLFALVDDADEAMLMQFNWHILPGKRCNYAANGRGGAKPTKNGRVLMHRLLLNPPADMQVDHINGDGLDNRRCNLRVATSAENNANRNFKNTTGFRGVYVERNGPYTYYRAHVGRPDRWRGPSRKDPATAARDYDAEACRRYGDFARLNFPRSTGAA